MKFKLLILSFLLISYFIIGVSADWESNISTWYFNAYEQNVNGYDAYALNETLDINYLDSGFIIYTGTFSLVYWASTVSIYNGITETILGDKIAIIQRVTTTDFYGVLSATWVSSSFAINENDSIIIKVYGRKSTLSTWYLFATAGINVTETLFTTPQLNNNMIMSSTWIFYYYVGYDYLNKFQYLNFGYDGVYESKIENVILGKENPSALEIFGVIGLVLGVCAIGLVIKKVKK